MLREGRDSSLSAAACMHTHDHARSFTWWIHYTKKLKNARCKLTGNGSVLRVRDLTNETKQSSTMMSRRHLLWLCKATNQVFRCKPWEGLSFCMFLYPLTEWSCYVADVQEAVMVTRWPLTPIAQWWSEVVTETSCRNLVSIAPSHGHKDQTHLVP